jgi:hypothetical protein
MNIKNQSLLQYNERSWAIELISAINLLISDGDVIQHAGGEYSLLKEKDLTLFPDIILFGNSSTGSVLQGWELKFPDTPIDDGELLINAEEKANRLGLDSFLVWNVSFADLYVRNKEDSKFSFYKRLYECNVKLTRNDVENRQDIWRDALKKILVQLNTFLKTGIILGTDAKKIFEQGDFIDGILKCHSKVKEYIERKSIKDNRLRAKIEKWWKYVSNSFADDNPFSPLAYTVLLSWINKFVFLNVIKAYKKADRLDPFTQQTTIDDALHFFAEFSQADIPSTPFDYLVPEKEWDELLSFNEFLSSIEFTKISNDVLSNIIKSITLSSIKKAAGLFVTPEPLAFLLVELSLRDSTDYAIDPFCGTGTIVNAILATKTQANIPGAVVAETTWGSDKFSFPVQVSTMAVFSPEILDRVLNIFVSDALDLALGKEVYLTNPKDGSRIKKILPLFSSIISNLPFIEFERINDFNSAVKNRMTLFYKKHNVTENNQLVSRSDFYAYIPFVLYDLLKPNGTLGIVTSNSWLSTDWGIRFRKLLMQFYNIDYVVLSAKGKWFKDADVVTSILVCSKKIINTSQKCKTTFVLTKQSLYDNFDPHDTAVSILSSDYRDDSISLAAWDYNTIKEIDSYNFGWMPFFTDLSWFLNCKKFFIPLKKIFSVSRGERRGWDNLFILSIKDAKKADQRFLKPHLKTLSGHYSLTLSNPDSYAFVCNIPPEELELQENEFAKKRIDSFRNIRNGTGRLLPDVLRSNNCEWYQFKIKAYADYVLCINPDSRHNFIRVMLDDLSVNQRVICLSCKIDEDKDFMHALLNTTISMLMIEMIGFGRGLGVLDLSSKKIENGFYILDPHYFNQESRHRIMNAFNPLLQRDAKAIPEELSSDDRRYFDFVVLSELGVDAEKYQGIIYHQLMTLYCIRKSVFE